MSAPAADAVPGTENATRSVFQDIYLNEQDVIRKQCVGVKSENINHVPSYINTTMVVFMFMLFIWESPPLAESN